ncbi:hypothetical protein [Nitrosospira lacus]|nr:hypothetical protein [Nitrosospira lacus]
MPVILRAGVFGQHWAFIGSIGWRRKRAKESSSLTDDCGNVGIQMRIHA